jgi:alkylated DNA repair protein (DNA oxidative demethylase)
MTRSEKPLRVPLQEGDVMVWGGPDRLRYHGVLPIKEGEHRLLGRARVNLTLRKAG